MWSGANMIRPSVVRANMGNRANVVGNMGGANLVPANMVRPNVVRANEGGANLVGADLVETNAMWAGPM